MWVARFSPISGFSFYLYMSAQKANIFNLNEVWLISFSLHGGNKIFIWFHYLFICKGEAGRREREGVRQKREKESKRHLPSMSSHTNDSNSWDLPNPGVRNSVWMSHIGGGDPTTAAFTAASQGQHWLEEEFRAEPGHKSRHSNMGWLCIDWHLNC